MSEYGVTNKGFVRKRLDVIISELQEDLTEGFGFDVSLNAESFLNVLVSNFGDRIAELWNVAEQCYYSQSPMSAEGVSLDYAAQLVGISREVSKRTQYTIRCTGKDGTVIPQNTRIGSKTSPQKTFLTTKEFEITRNDFNKVKVEVVAALANNTYAVTLNGAEYSYTPKESTTPMEILTALRGSLEDAGNDDFVFGIDETEEVLVIEDVNELRSNTLALSESLTTSEVSTLIIFNSEDYGKVILPVGSVTEIITKVSGFDSCTNVGTPVYGRLQETDIEFRQSYIKKISSTSSRMTESIESYISEKVDGVKSVKCYENDTDEFVDGRAPHSIEVIVDGGNESDIAQCILEKKTGGISTNGLVVVEVPDVYNDTITIRFNRPQIIYVWLKVKLTKNPKEVCPPNYAEITKSAIVNALTELSVGDDLFPQNAIPDIRKDVTGISYIDIMCYSSTDPASQPKDGDYNLKNVYVSSRQKINVDIDRIEVEFE